MPILAYGVQPSGWSDDLTSFHEENSGAENPIDVASRARALHELRKHLGADPQNRTLLEVGCSSGYLLREMRDAFSGANIIGADYVAGPLLKLAREEPEQPLLQLDLTACPLPDASVDAVVALNVLEHIEDDRRAVAEIFRVLKPGGVAVIELPVGPHLFDVYDKMLMHYRRYTARSATDLFANAGFRVEPPTHIGVFVYPAFALVKLANRRHLSKPVEVQRAIVAGNMQSTKSSVLMKALMKMETLGGKVLRYPFGIRVAFAAIKPLH